MPDPPVFINSGGLIFNHIFSPASVPRGIALNLCVNHMKFINNFYMNSDTRHLWQ